MFTTYAFITCSLPLVFHIETRPYFGCGFAEQESTVPFLLDLSRHCVMSCSYYSLRWSVYSTNLSKPLLSIIRNILSTFPVSLLVHATGYLLEPS